MRAMMGLSALALSAMVMRAPSDDGGAAAKDDASAADFWEKRFKALEDDVAALKGDKTNEQNTEVLHELADRVNAVEKAVNAKDRTGDGKTDKSANGRLAVIENHLGIALRDGEEVEKKDEDTENDPSSAASDKKAGKA